MAFDLPNSPTVNQIAIGPGGIQYQWDGVKWVALGLPSAGPIGIRIFTASGTYVPTPGIGTVIVECVGGGGGGGGASGVGANQVWGYGGGGGGGYSRRSLTAAQIGASVTVTIGAGGASTANGGATSFGSFCGANGGLGIGASTGGGTGGTVGNGDLTVPGYNGSYGSVCTTTPPSGLYLFSGSGGNSRYGSGGLGISGAATGTVGSAASGYGAGGGGGYMGTSGGTVAGGAGTPGLCIVTEYASLGQSGALAPNVNPNKLLNPFVEIDQAHEGAAVAGAAYVLDGWVAGIGATGGAVISSQRVADAPPGYTYSLRTTVTTAGTLATNSYILIYQIIEADELMDTAFGTASAQSLTLSVWLKSSVAGTYGLNIQNGPTSTRGYSVQAVITAANSWQLFTVTVPGDVVSGWTLSGNLGSMWVNICLAGGTTYQMAPGTWQGTNCFAPTGISNTIYATGNATFQVGPCKLEVGSIATPMRRRSFQSELSRCQRYYEKSYYIGTAPGTASMNNDAFWQDWYSSGSTSPSPIQLGGTYYFKVTKRAIPSFTLYSPTTGAAGKMRDGNLNADVTGNIYLTGTNSFAWYAATSTNTNNALLLGHMVADARL